VARRREVRHHHAEAVDAGRVIVNVQVVAATLYGVAAVVLFDGDCAVCEAAVRFVLVRDRQGLFTFARQDGQIGRGLLARHGLSGERGRSLILLQDGGAFLRSEAVLRIARALPGTRWLAAAARLVPRSWRDAAYDQFVRYRHRLVTAPPRRCLALPPELRARLLDP